MTAQEHDYTRVTQHNRQDKKNLNTETKRGEMGAKPVPAGQPRKSYVSREGREGWAREAPAWQEPPRTARARPEAWQEARVGPRSRKEPAGQGAYVASAGQEAWVVPAGQEAWAVPAEQGACEALERSPGQQHAPVWPPGLLGRRKPSSTSSDERWGAT